MGRTRDDLVRPEQDEERAPRNGRTSVWVRIADEPTALDPGALERFEVFDELYRSLCAFLYNYAPLSGHPGGSISSGRIVTALLFGSMDYDVSDPARLDADVLSYAAGHKALGLYAMWALRDEVVSMVAPAALPGRAQRLRIEDLIGFRRNPQTASPLFRRLRPKALDGHPTPGTPFVPLATGASGVGMASSLGLAAAAWDVYRDDPPRVHILEGEGGLTPGRVSEALAFAGTAGLGNAIVHVDWNQSSIDSDRVTREQGQRGDYVQWDPMELFRLHDWNVVEVPDGSDFRQIVAAQRCALTLDNGQPTAVVYRTSKGWRYGIEGRRSHGAGHALCSEPFYQALTPLLLRGKGGVPTCNPAESRCEQGKDRVQLEACQWRALQHLTDVLGGQLDLAEFLAERVLDARDRLIARSRTPRPGAPDLERAFALAEQPEAPDAAALEPGVDIPLRTQLGRCLGALSQASGGALLFASADLLDSTAISEATRGFPAGYLHTRGNPDARTLAVGGIAEDAMAGVLSGVSSFGWHVGVGSSYAAFLAPLGHVAARLHAIGNQARRQIDGRPYRPMVLVCGHAGLETGEDGPTHADPQALQLLQENFPRGTLITLTPWEPGEVWPLLSKAITKRPAVIAPFVTRPPVRLPDRGARGLAPAEASTSGVYLLRRAAGPRDGTLVLQGSGVAYAFIEETLPQLERGGIDLDVFYVASAELFDQLPRARRREIFDDELGLEAMGITGFTLSTLYRWVLSDLGREHSLHPFRHGRFLGSGPAGVVLEEAGLDGESQYRAIIRYLSARWRKHRA